MAPVKKSESARGGILSFFKPFNIPHPRWLDSYEPDEEIIVASPSSRTTLQHATKRGRKGKQSVENTNSPHASVVKASSDVTAQKRGRPRKIPVDTASQTSSSSSCNTSRRGRRSRKTESQVIRDGQLGAHSSSPPSPNISSDKSRSRYNVNPIDGAADVSPTPDSPYRSHANTPSVKRIVQGVEILRSPSGLSSSITSASPPVMANSTISTSRISTALSSTSDPQRGDEEPAAPDEFILPPIPRLSQASAPHTSFSSISTLTSVPTSSNASAVPVSSTNSNRRIMKDGLKGISNSDSEDSSGEELADLSSFYKPRNAQGEEARVASVRPTKDPSPRNSEKCSDPGRKRKLFATAPHSPPKKKYRNSLADLVRDHEKAQVAQATIASMEEEVEKARKREKEAHQMSREGVVDDDALIAAAGSDSDDRERMMMALERTEALQDEEQFYFFLEDQPSPAAEFPSSSRLDELWGTIYHDKVTRREACISGFAAELAAQFPLPVAVTNWMGMQLQRESNEALCEAYVEILRTSCAHHVSISNTFASMNAIYKTRSLFENNWQGQARTGLPPGLDYLIRVVRFCAPAADNVVPDAVPNFTSAAFLDFALVAVDENVKQSPPLLKVLSGCIETMLDTLSEKSFSSLVNGVIGVLFGPSHLSHQVRCRAIYALPVGTRRASDIRRRLALECFSTTTERKHSDSQDWVRSILDSLKTKREFQISSSTNYSLLIDLILILDVAVSAGWTDWSELHRAKPKGPFEQPAPASSIEKLHNQQMDHICKQLTDMMSRIKDAGTSHLRRMEAKDTIELVFKRLEYSVRSRLKPRKGVFDNKSAGGSTLRQATFDTFLRGQVSAASGDLCLQPTEEMSHVTVAEPIDPARLTQPQLLSDDELDVVEVVPDVLLSTREDVTRSEASTASVSLSPLPDQQIL